MDKMDNFIKKRLEDQSPAEDAWNIPSDDLWNDAKEHFPKQKKERKWFWLLMLLGFLLSTSVGFYFGKNTSTDITNASLQENTAIEEKKDITTLDKIEQQSHIDANAYSSDNSESPDEYASASNESSSDPKDNSKVVSISTKIETKSTFLPSESDKVTENKVNSFNQNEESTKESKEKSANKLPRIKPVNSLLSPVRFLREKPLPVVFKKVTQKTKMRHHPNQEFGIGYSESLIRLLDFIEIQDAESGSSFKLDMDYKNVNLHYTKWIKRKWSLSTGLYFSEFDIDINSSVFSEFTNEDIDTYVAQKLDDVIQLGQFSDFSSSPDNEFTINLVDNAQLALGDSVNIKTQMKFYSRIFQVPLLLNYHVYKNRFEWIFSAGASLDFEYFDQKESDIELYKEGILINEPTQTPAVVERNISSTIQGVVTMRYHINQRLNFGLSSKIYFNNPFLSNLEVGLYRRF